MDATSLNPSEIIVGHRSRELNRDVVEALKNSLVLFGGCPNGLKTPISVRFISDEEGYALVTGLHRLQACVELGWTEIPVHEERGSELDARLWEIAENLHRAELTVTERSEHIAEWIRLTEELSRVRSSSKLFQLETVFEKGGRGHKAGIREAARELGIGGTEAHRATKIANLSPEAKEEAKILHFDDNQRVLLGAAKQKTKEDQVRALREAAAKRADRVTGSEATASERRIESVISATKKLSHEELLVFGEWFNEYCADNEVPVFDRSSVGARKETAKPWSGTRH